MASKNSKNLFKFDSDFGVPIIIGTDEAGRGPGAGGVFASAVCFKKVDKNLIDKLCMLNDSKKLSKKIKEELYEIIVQNSYHATVCIEVEEIEEINILNASLKAMKLACEMVINQIKEQKIAICHCEKKQSFDEAIQKKKTIQPFTHSTFQPEILILVDGNRLIKNSTFQPFTPSPIQPKTTYQKYIIKGDSLSASIAAASILAKVSRDFYMRQLDEKYPIYNWKKNAGYLTKEHLSAINRYGITPHHRVSFLKKNRKKQLAAEI